MKLKSLHEDIAPDDSPMRRIAYNSMIVLREIIVEHNPNIIVGAPHGRMFSNRYWAHLGYQYYTPTAKIGQPKYNQVYIGRIFCDVDKWPELTLVKSDNPGPGWVVGSFNFADPAELLGKLDFIIKAYKELDVGLA